MLPFWRYFTAQSILQRLLWSGSVNLLTVFLGRPEPPQQLTNSKWTYFRQQLTTDFLGSAEGERITTEIISWSFSKKSYVAGLEFQPNLLIHLTADTDFNTIDFSFLRIHCLSFAPSETKKDKIWIFNKEINGQARMNSWRKSGVVFLFLTKVSTTQNFILQQL